MFRPMRRFKQALSDEECIRILKTEKRGTLAVIGDNGDISYYGGTFDDINTSE